MSTERAYPKAPITEAIIEIRVGHARELTASDSLTVSSNSTDTARARKVHARR